MCTGCVRTDPVFVTSKLAPVSQGYAEAMSGLDATIAALDLGRCSRLWLDFGLILTLPRGAFLCALPPAPLLTRRSVLLVGAHACRDAD